jgi:ABC-type multidrug transport system fused ATPase/permease subunit
MRYLKLYARVLRQLAPERALALALVLANVAVAFAQFAEPLLLGRVVDRLAAAQGAARAPQWREIAPLVALWGGFGLFTILAGVAVALFSDRLAQRRRMAAMADFFAHLLELSPGFHAETHTGRLTKIMLDGPNAMFGLWLTFFRERGLRRAVRHAAGDARRQLALRAGADRARRVLRPRHERGHPPHQGPPGRSR